MKAVIVEIRGSVAAVLSDDGCIKQVRNSNYAIGQVIDMNERRTIKASKLRVLVAAAAAFVILLGGTSAYAYSTPYSYVSVDVNPSIELTLNMFDRVLSVSAVNEDGAEVLSQIDLNALNNQNINNAITSIVNEISKEGYFEGGEGGIIIATASKDPDKADNLAVELSDTVSGAVDGDTETATPDPNATPDLNTTPDPNATPDPDATPNPEATPPSEDDGEGIDIVVISVGYERVQEARALGVTPGKLNLVQKLQASTADESDYATEEWINKSVQQIQAETKANRKANKAALPAETPAPEEDGTSVNETENEAGDSSVTTQTEQDKKKNNGNGNNNGSGNNSGKAKGKSGGNSNGNSNGNNGNSNGNNGNSNGNNGNAKGKK